MNQEHIESLLKGIFHAELLKSNRRIEPLMKAYSIRLDKNESAFDVPGRIKNIVAHKLVNNSWKNYPPPYYSELECLIADYCGTRPEQIVPGAGSANLITALLNYYGINNLPIILASPSFSLYAYHCNSYGIKFETWPLNSNLEYDNSLLPNLKPYSLVMFASPNNPVGNSIGREQLIDLLKAHPTTLFFLDQVYFEFQEENFIDLVDTYPNLLLLRSFSKTFSSAGLRIGYLIAHELLTSHIKKLILPFSLNILAVEFVKQILSDAQVLDVLQNNIKTTVEERNRVYNELHLLQSEHQCFQVYPSAANFLLVKFFEKKKFDSALKNIEQHGIRILDVSDGKALPYAFRMTIGKPEENDRILDAIKNCDLKKKQNFNIAS